MEISKFLSNSNFVCFPVTMSFPWFLSLWELGKVNVSHSRPYPHSMVLPVGLFRQRVVCKEFPQGLFGSLLI